MMAFVCKGLFAIVNPITDLAIISHVVTDAISKVALEYLTAFRC